MAVNLDALMRMFQTAHAKTNEQNEERYAQLMSIYGGGESSMADLINQFGEISKQRISANMGASTATAQNELVASGLGTPSVMQSMQRGYRSDAESQMQSVQEAQTRRQAGGLAGLAGAVEARTDKGPNMMMFAQLMQAVANQPQEAQGTKRVRYINGRATQPMTDAEWTLSSGYRF